LAREPCTQLANGIDRATPNAILMEDIMMRRAGEWPMGAARMRRANR
jgi:hypothetical protein